MIPNANHTEKHYGPQRHRGLKAALAQRLGDEFPRIGGPRILGLCAEMIMEVVETNIVARERVGHGQILWCAVDIRDRPRRARKAAETRMVPVVLTLHAPEDLERILRGETGLAGLRLGKILRMCREAHEQGALLSNVDLALMLGTDHSQVSKLISRHERETGRLVPRRTTLHDVGSGLSHKRIICLKRHLEGKDPVQTARETWHTLKSVENYLGQYERVRHCRKQGMDIGETAHILDCGERLVREYLEIDDLINAARSKPQRARRNSKQQPERPK
jgi:hypothetical protein